MGVEIDDSKRTRKNITSAHTQRNAEKGQNLFQFRRVNEHDLLVEPVKGWMRKKTEIELKSLILAQIERWRHALHMQVERQHGELAL